MAGRGGKGEGGSVLFLLLARLLPPGAACSALPRLKMIPDELIKVIRDLRTRQEAYLLLTFSVLESRPADVPDKSLRACLTLVSRRAKWRQIVR